MSLEKILTNSSKAMIIGIGGGGDVVGTLPRANLLKLHGIKSIIGGLPWERSVFDPVPGPRKFSETQNTTQINNIVWKANKDSKTDTGIVFAEAGVSEIIGEEDDDAVGGNQIKGTGPLSIRLRIGDSGRQVEASLNKAIHMGRLDPASDVFPEVDLTNDNGLERGVSRRHARILKREGTVVAEDLGSINGTFINGKRLAPYLPEVLRHGDQLQLGKLMIEIEMF